MTDRHDVGPTAAAYPPQANGATRIELKRIDAQSGREDAIVLDDRGHWCRLETAAKSEGTVPADTLRLLLLALEPLLDDADRSDGTAAAGFWFVRVYVAGVPVLFKTGTVPSESDEVHALPDEVLRTLTRIPQGFFSAYNGSTHHTGI